MANSYAKPNAEERKDMAEDGICCRLCRLRQGRGASRQRSAVCNDNINQRELNRKLKRRQKAKKILEEEL